MILCVVQVCFKEVDEIVKFVNQVYGGAVPGLMPVTAVIWLMPNLLWE